MGNEPAVAESCLSLSKGEAAGPIKTRLGFVIARLDNIKPVTEEAFEREKAEFTAEFTRRKENQHFNQWFSRLKEKAGLKSNI